MSEPIITTFMANNIRSLTWDGDELVDWAGGQRRFRLDGQETLSQRRYAYEFDAAIFAGDDALIYANYGTKGLVLRDGEILREINRSYYCANAYEYPVTLSSVNGRRVIIHCPDSYDRLDIEDFKTGKRLTAKTGREPDDFFHSRLCMSENSKYLLSAGWEWHPIDVIKVYDLELALDDPAHLDGDGLLPVIWAEEASAAFSLNGDLLVGLNDVEAEDGMDQVGGQLRVYDVPGKVLLSGISVDFKFGRIMPIGEDYVLNFYEHPRLVERKTGIVAQSWPDIACSASTSYIRKPNLGEPAPYIAIDLVRQRCAIADSEKITVITFA
jgi:hypothetical protein